MGAFNDLWHSIFSDPVVTVAVAFVIFIAVVGKKIWGAITTGLDARAVQIKAELDEATRLREEAQKLLSDYKRKQRDAEDEAKAIIAHAHEEAERLKVQAQKDLSEAMARREKQAHERIAQAETQALADVRNSAVSAAIAATAKLLADKLDDQGQAKLIDKAISSLDGKLH